MHLDMTQAKASLWINVTLALALGALLRLWFIHHAATVAGDTFIYGDIALSWMQHGVYGFSQPPLPPLPTLIRLPGYPLFLMLCFRFFRPEHYTAVLYLQCAVDLLACLFLSALARSLFGKRAGLTALVFAALCPFTASYAAAALTETLTLACITVAFYSLERWRTAAATAGRHLWLVCLAAALGYGILLRPEQGLLAAAILPAIVKIARTLAPRPSFLRALKPALAVAVGALLPLLPWTIRNERTFHVFQPLAPRSATDPGDAQPRGFNRWYRTWGIDFSSTEDVYWNYDGAPIAFADLPPRAFDSPAQLAETQGVLDVYNQTTKPSPALEARFDALAQSRIHHHPFRYYVGLPLARLGNMLFRPRIEMLPIPLAWWRWQEHPAQTAFALAYGALNLIYFVLGALGLYRWTRRSHDPTLPIAWSMIAFIALRCALLFTLDNSEPRYTLEFFPILIVSIAALAARRAIGVKTRPDQIEAK